MKLCETARGFSAMNKKELLIAQKAYLSRQIKNETANRSPSRRGRDSILPDISSPPDTLRKSTSMSLFSPVSKSASFEQRAQTAFHDSRNSYEDADLGFSTSSGESLISLAQRTMTPQALVRKVQSTISKELTATGGQSLSDDDNRYMPKVTLVRPDGSSLMDVYTSKREDVWSKIMKAQLAEEEIKKAADRQAKLNAHKEFGLLLKKQVDDHHARMQEHQNIDKMYAKAEPETTKKMAEAQKRRDEEGLIKRKQFISHALEDAASARAKRESLMRQEIEDSQIMVMKAKSLIAEDEKKKEAKKKKEAERLANLAKENLENIARRAAERKKAVDYERQAVVQAQQMSIQQEQRRKDDVIRIGNRVSLGPVYKTALEIVLAKKKREEELYKTLEGASNTLNTQLMLSEQGAEQRANTNTQYLVEDWDKQIKIHKHHHKEDVDRIEKIGEVMKQTIKHMEAEDEQARRRKHEAHMKYQRDLDAQLSDLRQRSISSLKETMTPTEMKYNADLVRKIRVKQ